MTYMSEYMDKLYPKRLSYKGQTWNIESGWWQGEATTRLSSYFSDMEPHVSGNLGRTDMMKPVVGHNLNDQNGLPDGIRVAVSQSLHLSGYLLNHGRRWHAFLINVQVHNAKTASGTAVAIADKAKVYILMPVSATWPQCRRCRSTRGPSFDPRENIALCLGPLNWCLFLTKSGEHTIKDSFDSPPSPSSSVFCNFCSGLRPAGSHMVGGNQHIPFLPHSSDSEDAYPSATGFFGIPPETKILLRMLAWGRSSCFLAFDRNQ